MFILPTSSPPKFDGIFAEVVGGKLSIYVTSAAVNGSAVIVDDTNDTPLAKCGISLVPAYYCPYLFYGTFAQTPTGGWYPTDSQPRPTGSIWWKTTSTGNGFNQIGRAHV